MRQSAGGAPRFGPAHFRLTAQTLTRSTFCYPDSFLEPSGFRVAARMGLIELAFADRQDELDDYIEAQVHASVQLQCDVDALVLDSCYRGTTVEDAALRLGCPVECRPGSRLGVQELRRHLGYRGQKIVDLGTQITVDGMLDPRRLRTRRPLYPPGGQEGMAYLARFGGLGKATDSSVAPAPREGAVLDGLC